MPSKKESIEEVFALLDKFEQISGLKVNKDKTQVMRIGKNASSDPILCPELGLKWVTKLKVLGIYLTAKPEEIMDNFKDKTKFVKTAGLIMRLCRHSLFSRILHQNASNLANP